MRGPQDSPMDPSSSLAGKNFELESVSTQKLEAKLKQVSKQASEYEFQMKDLESKLAEGLSNFRAVDSLLQEAFTGLRRNARRTDRALNTHVARITTELDESLDALSELTETLPTIQTQVADIRQVYDSGREKARNLVSDLQWLNTEFYERWRITIFTGSSPVSWRWKAFMRTLFTVSFVLCSYVVWIGISGAIRAYRHKLVWGEKLLS